MNLTCFLTPSGAVHLRASPNPDNQDGPDFAQSTQNSLIGAFEISSASGLIALVGVKSEESLPATLRFWRAFAHRLFQGFCQLGEAGTQAWKTVAPPSHEELIMIAETAPPMVGLEYLNARVLESLWEELKTEAIRRGTEFPQGRKEWLRTLHPLFHLVGRVHFHLAENKRDTERPFAFLATYTHSLSGTAKVQHLPLAEALKNYAAAGDRPRLESLLEPVRRAAQSIDLVRELLEDKSLFAPQAWNIATAYRFLHESLAMEELGIVVRVPNWWATKTSRRPEIRVSIGNKAIPRLGLDALMDFRVDIALGGEALTNEELKLLMEQNEGLFLLRGQWVEVDRAKIQEALNHWKTLQKEHPDGITFMEGMRLLAGVRLDKSNEDPNGQEGWTRVISGPWLGQVLEQMRSPDANGDISPGEGLRATLRPYQAQGVRWLDFMTRMGLGACLADDMGLGKTVQVIDLLLQTKKRSSKVALAPALLIVPASLLGNWKTEISRFAPDLSFFLAHSSENDQAALAEFQKDPAQGGRSLDLVITTYANASRQQWPTLLTWSLVILDEAQAIKNAGAAQTRSVKKIPCNGRIVLTGTPVENQLGDLWSLFDFCCPGLLGNAAQFKRHIKAVERSEAPEGFGALRKLVRPYILRRMKTDPGIAPDLPEKTEMRVECPLSRRQAAFYEKTLKNLGKSLKDSSGMARRGLVLATMVHLKQICNHPDLFLNNDVFLPEESGKFDRLMEVAEPIRDRQEKMLVFTQFQSMTQPLAQFLGGIFGESGLVLHGQTPIRKRQDFVKQFQSANGPGFFVISLKAGGSGLNLTAASHVVHFDRWWNPAVENQATDRAFRIGQKNHVLVHKLVCRGTVEERIDQMIREKRALADQILGESGDVPLLTEMSDQELLQFLALDLERAVEV